MKAILYIGHGTRSQKGREEADHFIQKVMRQVDVPIQEICYLELTPPFIEEGFIRCVNQGATDITVVPLFLIAAGHMKKDIPETINLLMSQYPTVNVRITEAFGVQEWILDTIVALVMDIAKEIDQKDSLLIVGRGSSDPDIHAAFKEISEGISSRLQIKDVSVCYLAATVPTFNDGLHDVLQRAKTRVIVVPYLLFSGLLLSEIRQKIKKKQREGYSILQTGVLTSHPLLEDLLIQRATGKEKTICSH